MKFSRMAIALAATSMFWTSAAWAQVDLLQPTNVTAFESYYAQADESASPSDKKADAPAAVDDSQGCASGCGRCDRCRRKLLPTLPDSCCPLDCPDECTWRLFDCWNNSNCRGLSVTGFIAQSYTWNPDNPSDNFNGPQTFNDRANEYQLNQFYTTIEKSLGDAGCCWQIGGRVDLLWGTDYRFTTAGGLEDTWNNRRFYGIALPQAYVEIGYNDLRVKLGHYYTIIGYETVPAAENFFLSHAYTMQYGEPFTHTGALFTYDYHPRLQLIGGFDQGWDLWEDDNSQISFLGGVNWTSSDARTTIAGALTFGDENVGATHDERAMGSFVLTHKLNDRWTYVFQSDAGQQQQGDVANGNDAEWYGINQYLYYDINCCWTAGLRFEWFRDDDGTRVGSVAPGNTIFAGSVTPGDGFSGDFYEISLGANYKPNANLVFRPEVRWDWYSGPDAIAGGRPYDAGTDSSQTTLAFDVIWLY